MEATTPEFKDIPFSETKSIYEVQKENLVLDSACETVTFRGKQYDLGMRQKSGKEVNYFYCEPSWMKLDNKVVLKLAYGAEAPGETLLVFLDPSKGLTTKLELQTGGEYDYKFIHKLTNNHMLAAVNGTLYNIDLASETLLEQYKLKYRDFGDKTKEILVKDASTIEVLRTYEDGSGEFVEKFHPVTALKL
ncbi:hypothetical protein K3G39_13895 [Pontibacter sp. HSC-14F20]|uniref:hypothetical protein n=1 Tax=Pontibacter sp. HSC-14F20 TaxID=2864136 RepID=UPI001C736AD1|nr:hypothetical protein [Pontibacter sp. HSC-14F20]MBX0334330.1 hypothetical protein [Pontibacter sp. HSC-14F20]